MTRNERIRLLAQLILTHKFVLDTGSVERMLNKNVFPSFASLCKEGNRFSFSEIAPKGVNQ